MLQSWTLVGGEKVFAHPVANCIGPCAVHAPTDHPMAAWRQHWRDDRALMERICIHGVGHPDPDHMTWVEIFHGQDAAAAESVHGCCGCCR